MCMFDDILVCGTDEQECKSNLENMLERCTVKFTELSRKKINFCCNCVSFYDHMLINDDLKAIPKKIKAIKNM